MSDSLQKAFFGVIALSLSVIAIQLIPFAKHRELQNLCLEFEIIQWDALDSKRRMKKQKLISKKAGLKKTKYVNDEVEEFCDLLNTNSN